MTRPIQTQADLDRALQKLEHEAAEAGLSFLTALHTVYRRGRVRAEAEAAALVAERD